MITRSLLAFRRSSLLFSHGSQLSKNAQLIHTSVRTRPLNAPVWSACEPSTLNRFSRSSRRGAASEVTNKPGSQTPKHAAQNIKEEVSGTAGSVARGIAGANMTVDNVTPTKPLDDSFIGITSAVASAVPKPVLVFGLAGGLPYLGTAASVIYTARQAGLATAGYYVGMDPGVASTILDQALNIQVTYGAVMLSFLGALHWGMEFVGHGGQQGYRRLTLGIVPVIWGWTTLALDPTMALIFQWVGFTGMWWADLKATTAGWTPKWYSQYRFYLSILVGTCIIASLAGTSYYGPVAGHGIETHDLSTLRERRKRKVHENEGTTKGDIEALPASDVDENADAYVVLKKHEEPEEKDDEGKDGEEGAGKEGEEQDEEKGDGEDKTSDEDEKPKDEKSKDEKPKNEKPKDEKPAESKGK